MHLRHLLLAFVAFCPLAAAQVPAFDDVVVGIVPLDGGGTVPLYTDVYLPANAGAPTPCVVWIHGGGWLSGSHNGLPAAVAALIPSGVAVASAGHRFSDQAIFPAQLHDVKGLVRHLRANAALYNIDPDRIACWGASSGGHLAALLATTGDVPALEGNSGGNTQYSSRVLAAVDYNGPTDLLMLNPGRPDSAGLLPRSRLARVIRLAAHRFHRTGTGHRRPAQQHRQRHRAVPPRSSRWSTSPTRSRTSRSTTRRSSSLTG
jgi:poly(3-hydroxybutyrate) depolymerase